MYNFNETNAERQKQAWLFGVSPDKMVWAISHEIHAENHTLIAGTSGSGKSVFLNSIIWSYLAFPDYYVFIDLKRVELSKYKIHPRTLAYVNEEKDVLNTLDWIIKLMNDRFAEMESQGKVLTDRPIVHVIIDELADLLTIKGVEERITKLMRLGRAARIKLLMATQSPNRRVITPNIQQNVSCAIALRCRSAIESRQIIGIGGAEKLPQYGKGIFWNSKGIREIAIPMTDENDIERRIRYGE